jgi:hypothetical protein
MLEFFKDFFNKTKSYLTIFIMKNINIVLNFFHNYLQKKNNLFFYKFLTNKNFINFFLILTLIILYFISNDFNLFVRNLFYSIENFNFSDIKINFSYKNIFIFFSSIFDFLIFFLDFFYLIDFLYPTTNELYKNNIF